MSDELALLSEPHGPREARVQGASKKWPARWGVQAVNASGLIGFYAPFEECSTRNVLPPFAQISTKASWPLGMLASAF
jgi:hypothetical protein